MRSLLVKGLAVVSPILVYAVMAGLAALFLPGNNGELVKGLVCVVLLGGAVAFLSVNGAARFIAGGAAVLCFWKSDDIIALYWAWYQPHLAAMPDGNAVQHLRYLNQVFGLLTEADVQFLVLGCANGLAGIAALAAIARTSLNPDSRKQSKSDLFGDARWMRRRIMAKLSRKGGIILGQFDKPHETRTTRSPLMQFPLQAHGLTCAPSRSGKGLVIAANLLAPNTRSWQGPVVVIDPKGEAYMIAARRRRELGRRVVLLDPFAVVKEKADAHKDLDMAGADSWDFNPLDFVRQDERMIADINVILDALVVPAKDANASGAHFADGARRVIASSICWIIATVPQPQRNLMAVRDLLNQEWAVLGPQLEKMAASDAAFGLAADGARLLLSVGEKERGSFLSTVTNALAFLQYRQIQHHMSKSGFSLDGLSTNDLDLFIVVPSELLEKVRMYLRLWVTLPMAQVSRQTPEKRVLLMLDEMPAIGRLTPVLQAYRMAAGKGLSVWGFTQTFAGLIDEYGREAFEDIRDNADFVQFFEIPPTAKRFSEEVFDLIGQATFKAETENSERLIQRPLVTPEDLRNMDYRKQIVLARTRNVEKAPMHLWQPRYFLRPDCKKHADPNPYIIA